MDTILGSQVMERKTASAGRLQRVYQLRYDTRAQARLDIVDWIEGFYNRQRMHSAINYQIPAAAESGLRAA